MVTNFDKVELTETDLALARYILEAHEDRVMWVVLTALVLSLFPTDKDVQSIYDEFTESELRNAIEASEKAYNDIPLYKGTFVEDAMNLMKATVRNIELLQAKNNLYKSIVATPHGLNN